MVHLLGFRYHTVPILWLSEGSFSASLFSGSQSQDQSGARDARLAQGCCRRLGYFDAAIEEILARGEQLQMFADIARSVGVDAEVAVQREEIRVVVELMAAETALQAECSDGGFVGAQIECGHVARDFRYPVAEILRAA